MKGLSSDEKRGDFLIGELLVAIVMFTLRSAFCFSFDPGLRPRFRGRMLLAGSPRTSSSTCSFGAASTAGFASAIAASSAFLTSTTAAVAATTSSTLKMISSLSSGGFLSSMVRLRVFLAVAPISIAAF